ncbi:MAG TPA: hypothetical protein O0X32_03440, partial [Methanocorpusculum sp.]|nr:hypothetical protein [Methanocorpusculum sp.]
MTAREDKSFMADFGLAQGNRIYSQGDIKSANNTFNLYDFVISFPVYKTFATYMGFTPYSSLGYSISSEITDASIIGNTGNITSTADGYGGMNNLFIGGGVKIFKGLNAGVEYEHLFGNIEKTYSQVFSNTSFRSLYSGYSMHLKSDVVKLGIQYEFPLSKSVTATLGATYKFSANLKGTVQDYE